MRKIETGQVWQTSEGLMMVSEDSSGARVLMGEAKIRGACYVMVGSPKQMDVTDLKDFVFDTEER
jgi:hypothetical protein